MRCGWGILVDPATMNPVDRDAFSKLSIYSPIHTWPAVFRRLPICIDWYSFRLASIISLECPVESR